MEPGVSPSHITPRSRPPAGMVPWRGGHIHRPVPLTMHSDNIPYYQNSDLRSEYQPWPDAWNQTNHQHPAVPTARPVSRAELYERRGYPFRPQSRQNYEEVYPSYPVPVPREDYGGYYHMQSRAALEEQDWRQRDYYRRQDQYWDPRQYSAPQAERVQTPFPPRVPNLYRENNTEDSYMWTARQERNGDDFQRNTHEESILSQTELPSSSESSLLRQYKESGLSSSSYELSQYICDSSDPCLPKTWSPMAAEDVSTIVPQSITPLKYSIPHVTVCFGAGGQMVRVCPNYPAEGQPAVIEIHSLELILHDTQEQEEMRAFCGPLVREDLHKVDVINYCQRKAALIKRPDTTRSRDVVLLWQLLVLLCRQNGSMVGSDIADLLMQDTKRERYKKQATNTNLINLSDESWPAISADTTDLLTGEVPSCTETAKEAVEKFTKLLFYGRKKEALEWAMRSQLWGHALFLSSKMDLRTYSWVMSRFTSSLVSNDPLQTLFQLMSGRIPQACTCCGDVKWGDWRPHLAVILSNVVGDADLTRRSILIMGDTLAMKGQIEASHCCYLTANIPFGFYNVKKDPLVLLGSSHSKSFRAFATTEAIQRTEILEYCHQLGQPGMCIPSFQVYKLIYASRLVDYGLTSQALHYCEGIGAALLAKNSGYVLLAELIKLAERLKFSDPCLLEGPEQKQELEPDWLVQLRVRLKQLQASYMDGAVVENDTDNGIPGQLGHSVNSMSIQGSPEHTMPTHSQQDIQSATRTQGDEHTHAEEYYSANTMQETHSANTRQETRLWQLGNPSNILPVQSFASAKMDVHEPDETTVTSNSVEEEHPGGHEQVAVPQEDLAQDVSSLIYHPPVINEPRDGLWQSHARLEFDNNKQMRQHIPVSRIRTVSECSTISVDEDASLTLNGETSESTQQSDTPPSSDQDQEPVKKTSGSGWFSWFRSKPSKEEATPIRTDMPPIFPNLTADPIPAVGQDTTTDVPLATTAETSRTALPPPPPTSMSQSGRNPFSRSSGNKDASVWNDGKSPPLSPGKTQLVPAFTRTGLPPPAGGCIPLFNPSQVPSSLGNPQNHPPKLSQRRYPTQR